MTVILSDSLREVYVKVTTGKLVTTISSLHCLFSQTFCLPKTRRLLRSVNILFYHVVAFNAPNTRSLGMTTFLF